MKLHTINSPQTPFQIKSNAIYLTTLLLIITGIACLPLVSTTISIKSTGIIRPQTERTEIKPFTSGFIDHLFTKEGDTVSQGQLLACIQDRNSLPRLRLNEIERIQRQVYIKDLTLLTSEEKIAVSHLQSPLYKQQLNRFLFQLAEQEAALKKVQKEREINQSLITGKIITPKEYFDKEIEAERMSASFQSFQNEQKINWQNDLSRYRMELVQFIAQQYQIEADKKNHLIYAPVSGIIQNSQHRYAGGFIQAGETLCTISPQTTLIAECYVSTRDVGLLQKGQTAKFQIEAFDYNYFGVLTGTIASIDNDFSLIDNKPFFKVKCNFDRKQLLLKNGYSGELKKGLSLHARFIVAERTLWQLLFDKIDDWFNPNAPSPIQTISR
ncbi:HlyD family secretion protein [Sediminibacterium goheungense]|uniref:HlyD family secretion protein n=1 Tax=Sediminibacterium goheungense TaxID=1086393 RepID=A0A4R6ITZ7_9BACT|nr:HlyD family efflux transporter periplasmic adaptor subunit [Sediminibacterium goheungense]TDO25426.1 HlyD family secretion protein [Sediminibacterium goheungense]